MHVHAWRSGHSWLNEEVDTCKIMTKNPSWWRGQHEEPRQVEYPLWSDWKVGKKEKKSPAIKMDESIVKCRYGARGIKITKLPVRDDENWEAFTSTGIYTFSVSLGNGSSLHVQGHWIITVQVIHQGNYPGRIILNAGSNNRSSPGC